MHSVAHLNLEITGEDEYDLNERIRDFKSDPQNMEDMDLFIDGILKEAEKKAHTHNESEFIIDRPASPTKSGNGTSILSNLKRGRVATRVRGVALRVYEAICNCANNAVQIPGRNPPAPKT